MATERRTLDILKVHSQDPKPIRSWTYEGMLLLETDTLELYQLKGGAWVRFVGSSGSGVDSVFGRTGTVTAQSGDYTTTLVTEGTNLYFTDLRARNAITKAHVDSLGVNAATLGGLGRTGFGELSATQTWAGANTFNADIRAVAAVVFPTAAGVFINASRVSGIDTLHLETNDNIDFAQTANGIVVRITNDGSTAIGHASPTEALDVNGKIRQRTATAAGDADNIVADKGYVDSQLVPSITAPAAPASGARLYVDAADGDLKVRFANGTVKTIATN